MNQGEEKLQMSHTVVTQNTVVTLMSSIPVHCVHCSHVQHSSGSAVPVIHTTSQLIHKQTQTNKLNLKKAIY